MDCTSTTFLNMITNPEIISLVIVIIVAIPRILSVIKKHNKIKTVEDVFELAKEVTYELSKEYIDNESKRNLAVDSIIKRFPNALKYISKEDILLLVDTAYHSCIKPSIKGKKNG